MLIPLKLVRDQPLQQQIYDQLRGLVETHRLLPGSRMPSTRMVADQFAVSRITVLLAYERLIAEGYLETVPAKGTFVSHPAAELVTGRPAKPAPAQPVAPVISAVLPCSGGVVEGRVGRPDPALFPMPRWRALLRNAVDRLAETPGTQHAAGGIRLRQAITRWLSSSRGLGVAPEQIILVSGRQQALHIVADLLLRRGARAVLEDPCDSLTACTYAEADAELVPVAIDESGLCTDRLPDGPAALLHVTPEHQRPSGVVMSAERRSAVLDWAAKSGAVVLEESCDAELRYGRLEAPPLMSLDETGRVIHIGGFATALGPWLTAGFMAVPRPLVSAAQHARRLMDDSAPSLESAALAEMLESGAYARHLHRLRKTYMTRRDTLVGALHRHFGPVATSGGDAGLHLAWQVAPEFGRPEEVAEIAQHSGLEAAALCCGPEPSVLLGFGLMSERQLEVGVAQMALALSRMRAPALRRVH